MNPNGDRYAVRNRALAFAARAHKEQIRKGTNNQRAEDLDDSDKLLGAEVPYFMHPAAVGMLLLEHRASDEAVIAGILHDVIEDTEITREVVEQAFGKQVAELVSAESEPDKTLPWRARKQHTIEHLAACSDKDVKLVAAADKLHNVQSIQLDLEKLGENVWERFNASKDEQAWYYHEIANALTAQGGDHPLYQLLRQTVVDVFGPAKPAPAAVKEV